MDCARAICALYIVGFWHLFHYIGIAVHNTVTTQICNGVLAAFTFISGYFLGAKVINSFRSALIFYYKRFLSFYPLFLIACALLINIGFIGGYKQYLLTVTGLSCFIPPLPPTAWYFCMMIIFYLLTPLINACQGKKKLGVMLVIEIMFILARRFLGINNTLCFHFPFYCAGICIPRKGISSIGNYISMLAATVVFILTISVAESWGRILPYINALSVVVFIICLGRILEKTALLTILTKISYASMCAYLFHRPFYVYAHNITGDFPIWAAYLVFLPAMLILSYGIQYVYDKLVKGWILTKLPR